MSTTTVYFYIELNISKEYGIYPNERLPFSKCQSLDISVKPINVDIHKKINFKSNEFISAVKLGLSALMF